MRVERNDEVDRIIFDSFDEAVHTAEKHRANGELSQLSGYLDQPEDRYGRFMGPHVNNDNIADYCLNGWQEQADKALEIAESAVSKVEQEVELTTFQAVFDVAGADVDMGRYLGGEPECMVDYPLVPTVKAGRVITLCIGSFVSAGISAEAIIKRGQVIMALTEALSRLGYSTEIWLDNCVQGEGSKAGSVRIKVKGPNDVMTPAQMMFALAHPAATRYVQFACMHSYPTASIRRATGAGRFYGMKHDVVRDMPEGTIYLEGTSLEETAYKEPDEILMDYLRQLELTD